MATHAQDSVAIVLLSGGQDSATCLAMASTQHQQCHCVSFDYGQRHRIELSASRVLADLAGASHECVDVSFMAGLSNASLVNDHQAIATSEDGLPNTFVPGRNALFLTVAAMVAHQRSATVIYTGVCQTDYSGYPDCRLDFIQSQTNTLNLAMATNVTIETPLMHITKAQTVLAMQALGKLDWYAHTHTCYEGAQPACGVCPACQLRLKGFNEAGIDDPLPYAI
tara:strand:+ start:2016 stop:2687 length:672 start_codon:yes stop_codon:yes gene_type:complete